MFVTSSQISLPSCIHAEKAEIDWRSAYCDDRGLGTDRLNRCSRTVKRIEPAVDSPEILDFLLLIGKSRDLLTWAPISM